MLWDALKCSYLVDNEKPQDVTEDGVPEATVSSRFTLDTVIEDEGSNLSVGQRSLGFPGEGSGEGHEGVDLGRRCDRPRCQAVITEMLTPSAL